VRPFFYPATLSPSVPPKALNLAGSLVAPAPPCEILCEIFSDQKKGITPHMTDTMHPPVLYGAKKIADFLGVSPKVVYHLIESRRIPYMKIGRTVAARPESLIDALAQLENGTAA